MWKKEQIRHVIKRAVAPVAITVLPGRRKNHPFQLKIPFLALPLITLLSILGLIHAGTLAGAWVRYQTTEHRMSDYAAKVGEFNAAFRAVKQMEGELRALLSQGSERKILESVETADMGAMDIFQIQKQIEISMETVAGIREYLRERKDLFMATPRGYPLNGTITSPFGSRINPITGRVELHRGIDIAAPAGTPIQATADGVVSFSGWNRGGGYMVVVEHGHGFSTCYAHNRANAVRVGQRVQRGDTLGYVGATGNATGNHLHYEIWQDGRVINPRRSLEVARVP
ncbi:MAG: M23 family metallopeptidase [Pseudomonadota bacterium]|nr:M23 family metallopeptidase [Pseudomonadota bacterium]